MSLYDIPHHAIERAACRKAGLPAWRIASLAVVTCRRALVHFVGSRDVVTVTDRDVHPYDDLAAAPIAPGRMESERGIVDRLERPQDN